MSDAAVDLLFRVLVDITTGARRWAQGFYALTEYTPDGSVCGSAYCLAGNICLAAGFDIEPDHHRLAVSDYRIARRRSEIPLHPAAFEISTHGTVVGRTDPGDAAAIAVIAQARMEITQDEADELFHPDTTLAELWERAEQISDGRITIPADLISMVDARTATPVTVPA